MDDIKKEQLKLKEENGMYPPRIRVVIGCSTLARPMHARFQFTGATDGLIFDVILRPQPSSPPHTAGIRTYLVVRFFSLRAPIPNKRNLNVILQCWMQCACAVVARHVRALHPVLALTTAGRFACLLASINNLYIQVLASAFCQLLYHFLPYITWIAPARQQCSTFC